MKAKATFKIAGRIITTFFLISIFGSITAISKDLAKSPYNIVWNSPSDNENGSMPTGNGDIGLNVWVENNGDICFYISKTDSWSEDGRLLKVGKVRVKCEPALVSAEAKFTQELDLNSGTILISSTGKKADLKFRVWVDANNPAVMVDYNCSLPVRVKASVELWRNQPYKLTDAAFSDFAQSHSNPNKTREPVLIQPDVIAVNAKKEVVWYHHNTTSQGFEYITKLEGISEFAKNDPYLNRIFGALLKAGNTVKADATSVETSPGKKGAISVFVLTKQPATPEEWKKEMDLLVANSEKTSFNKRKEAHDQWWGNFWNRSWIEASPAEPGQSDAENSDAFVVSRAYALQRFITASAGRGTYAIKFNGSIFTVNPPKGTLPNGITFADPDFRRWGPGYWWQNTRLPYISMCSSGDFDMMQPLFKMYTGDIYQLAKQRTKKNFGFEGVYFPECMYFWGAQFPFDFGPKPWEDRTDKLQDSRYHKWEWVSGPELVFMMLDYYDYTGDQAFLTEKIIPVANDILRFFNNFYKTNANGKLVMFPSQALETWWDCTNPMPEISGLHSICQRLLALPENIANTKDRQLWVSVRDKLPELPIRETASGKALAPAERAEQKRNIENPELYAVFPFRQFGIGNPNLEWAVNAFKTRGDRGTSGWRQDDVFMAYLGLTEQVKSGIVSRAKTYNKESRFPAFWGPNYDWTPDQDHGGILMKVFQSMLMQTDPYSDKIYLLPAWPKEWNVRFKLAAPGNTSVQGELKNGKLVVLNVFPEIRRKDIVVSKF